jgi:hypothetical protein
MTTFAIAMFLLYGLLCGATGFLLCAILTVRKTGPRPTGETYTPKHEGDIPWPDPSPVARNKTDLTGWEA